MFVKGKQSKNIDHFLNSQLNLNQGSKNKIYWIDTNYIMGKSITVLISSKLFFIKIFMFHSTNSYHFEMQIRLVNTYYILLRPLKVQNVNNEK